MMTWKATIYPIYKQYSDHPPWALKIGLPKRKLVFQPSIFSGYVSFRQAITFFVGDWQFNFESLLALTFLGGEDYSL